MAFRQHKDRWLQPDEFLAGEAVHLTGGGVGFYHGVRPDVIDHQPVTCSFKDVSVLFFGSPIVIRHLTYRPYLLFFDLPSLRSSLYCNRRIPFSPGFWPRGKCCHAQNYSGGEFHRLPASSGWQPELIAK